VGKLYHKPWFGDWSVTDVEEDGGDSGCDKMFVDIDSFTAYKMKLYWNNIEQDESRVFND
jgi:hypothetical protein